MVAFVDIRNSPLFDIDILTLFARDDHPRRVDKSNQIGTYRTNNLCKVFGMSIPVHQNQRRHVTARVLVVEIFGVQCDTSFYPESKPITWQCKW